MLRFDLRYKPLLPSDLEPFVWPQLSRSGSTQKVSLLIAPDGPSAATLCWQLIRPVGRVRHLANSSGDKQIYGSSAVSLGRARN
jgi:hypothetical protein